MVRVEETVWTAIDQHAAEAYPDECCGLVTVDGDGHEAAHPCENIQNKLHEQDPDTHPRTARTAYRMDDLQVTRIIADTEGVGGRLNAIYHSHVDCGAYFSEEDQDAAMFFGELAYPGVVYLVVSVYGDSVKNRKAFAWSEGAKCFEEVPIETP